MVKRTGPTNLGLRNLIQELKKASSEQNVKIWKRIAEDLSRSTRIRREVNIDKINRYAKDKETIVVPGKVLGVGELNKDVSVAAFRFSESAKKKIKNSLTIQELIKKNPKGKKVRIIG